jgi:hypothetical protein
MSIYNLTINGGSSDVTVTTAGTTTCDAITGLTNLSAVSVQARFVYGSGGTTCKAYVQTSIDQGTTWIDVACLAFATTNATKVVNLSGMTPVTTPATPVDGALADNSSLDGILGDRLRVKVISTGTYAGGTVLSVRVMER